MVWDHNRFLCLQKHVSMPFFCHRKVFVPAKICFYCDVGWLEGYFCVASSCSLVSPNTTLLWWHRIPVPPTGGTRPPPCQLVACGEPVHDRRHAATPSTTGGLTSQWWICARPPYHTLSLPPNGASSPPLPPNGGCLL